MKLEKASYEIWDEKIPLHDHIEICGRICYASEATGGEKAIAFCDRLIRSGHLSVLEHGTVYLKLNNSMSANVFLISQKYDRNKYSVVNCNDHENDVNNRGVTYKEYFITTNLRVIVENNWMDDLQYACACEPTAYHDKRITVKWNVNRAIANEIVRHKIFCVA